MMKNDKMSELKNSPLSEIVENTWKDGKEINLHGIGYGRIHWGNRSDIRDEPSPYYFFLAGLVQRYDFNRVLEIGTHWGGATRAMWHGIRESAQAKIVTVDITKESDNRLNDYPDIEKIIGDGNSDSIFKIIYEKFEYKNIDMIYIDAEHKEMPTFKSFALYSMALRPKVIVLDDITLNDEMRSAWQLITNSLPDQDTINAADVVRAIRPSPDNPGFGIVRLAHNIK